MLLLLSLSGAPLTAEPDQRAPEYAHDGGDGGRVPAAFKAHGGYDEAATGDGAEKYTAGGPRRCDNASARPVRKSRRTTGTRGDARLYYRTGGHARVVRAAHIYIYIHSRIATAQAAVAATADDGALDVPTTNVGTAATNGRRARVQVWNSNNPTRMRGGGGGGGSSVYGARLVCVWCARRVYYVGRAGSLLRPFAFTTLLLSY